MFPLCALLFILIGHLNNVTETERDKPKVVKSNDRSQTSDPNSWQKSCTGDTGCAALLSNQSYWTLSPLAKILKVNIQTNLSGGASLHWAANFSFCLLTVYSFIRNAAMHEWAASYPCTASRLARYKMPANVASYRRVLASKLAVKLVGL